MSDKRTAKSIDSRRRKILRYSAMGTVLGLAGCQESGDTPTPDEDGGDGSDGSDGGDGGDGDGGGDGSDGSDGSDGDDGADDDDGDGTAEELGEPVDDEFFFPGGGASPFTDTQINPFNQTNYNPGTRNFFFEHLMKYNFAEARWEPHLVRSVDIEGTTVTLNLHPDRTWHNGRDFTAEDVATKFRLNYYFNYPEPTGVWTFVEEGGLEVVDDNTLEMSLQGEVNQDVFFFQTMDNVVDTPRFIYNEYIDRFEDAHPNEDDVAAVKQDLAAFNFNEPIGTSPWRLSQMGPNTLLAEPYENHEHYDKIQNFNLRVERVNDPDQAIISNRADGHNSAANDEATRSQYPDHFEIVRAPGAVGEGMHFDHGHEIFGNYKVRQAIAYFLDREQIRSPNPDNFGQISLNAGLHEPLIEPYIDDAGVRDHFNEYMGSQPDKATELLESEGFSQQNGTWVTPDGEEWSVEVNAPAPYTPVIRAFRVINQQFNDFGINSELITQDPDPFWANVNEDGDYSMIYQRWGGWSMYPLGSYQFAMTDSWAREAAGFEPSSVEVPKPPEDIGTLSGSGSYDVDDTMSVNVSDLIQETAVEPDPEQASERIRSLAWVWNQIIPTFQYSTKDRFNIQGTDDWNVASDSPAWNIGQQGKPAVCQNLWEWGGLTAKVQEGTGAEAEPDGSP